MQSKKIQLLESIASTIMAESVETEECLDVACEQISMVLSHIRGLPRQIHGENAFNCPSDSLILPEVEDSGGIVTLGKLKRDGPEVELIFLEKEGHYSSPCCGRFGHDASDCPVMRSEHLNGSELGYW
ncbi:hypothetical protein Peur_054991 [Populus x canadensis]